MKVPFSREFAAKWNILLAGLIGIGFGAITLPITAISLTMIDMSEDMGWNRAQVSLASTVTTGCLLFAAPFVGFFIDRFRVQWVVGFSSLAMGTSFILMGNFVQALPVYLISIGAMAILAAGTTTIPYARVVSLSFPHNRGKALGMSMVGNGVTGTVLPLVLVPMIAEQGWRSGFITLGTCALIVTPIILLLLTGAPRPEPQVSVARSDKPLAAKGYTIRQALRSRPFKVLGVTFLLVSMGAAGFQVHFVSILGDGGLSTATITLYASFMGIALAAARVITGFCLDRFPAALVSCLLISLGAISAVTFALGGPWATIFGAIAIGFTIGAEIDMVGYFVSRFFGFKAYGKVYGMLYSTVLLGTAFSPIIYGSLRDVNGNYLIAMLLSAGLFVIAAILLFHLRVYPYADHEGMTLAPDEEGAGLEHAHDKASLEVQPAR